MSQNIIKIDFNNEIHKSYIKTLIERNNFYIDDIKTQYLNDYDVDEIKKYPKFQQKKMMRKLKRYFTENDDDKNGFFITTLKKNNSVGVCGFVLYNIEYNCFNLTFMLIDKSFQNKRHGTTLLTHLINVFDEESLNNMTLNSLCVKIDKSNIKPINFYLKNGFLTLQQLKSKYDTMIDEECFKNDKYVWVSYPSKKVKILNELDKIKPFMDEFKETFKKQFGINAF